jgi:hypothetical protein
MREVGEKGEQMCLLYRMLQINHQRANKRDGPLLPPMLCCAELFIILAAYSIIMRPDNNSFTTWASSCIPLVVTPVMILLLKYGKDSTDISQKYIEVVKHIRSSKVMTTVEIKFFRSLYPLDWKIGYGGNGFKLTKESIQTIFQDIIVGNLINLIVATKVG